MFSSIKTPGGGLSAGIALLFLLQDLFDDPAVAGEVPSVDPGHGGGHLHNGAISFVLKNFN